MGYTPDNPPIYVRPLLEEYNSLTVDRCGYKQGSWVALQDEDGTTFELKRVITNSIEIYMDGRRFGEIATNVTERSTAKRDEMIGEILIKKLGGHHSFKAAIQSLS